ncbi:DUF2914 domain-containing protein [Rheinheimera tilapiae]|uniref:DUF2914 domain-containing protein n=1 Tax=Rheinheimera tilapiae TaxID=875043 RepID=A0ABV6BIX3_9GAMM
MVSEAASKLTVKVKLHPAALPAETDTPVVQPAPWSKTRIALASLVLVGAGVAGYQFLLRPVAPLKSAVAAEPEQAALQSAAVTPTLQSVAEQAGQAESATASSVTPELKSAVETAPLTEQGAQPALSQAEVDMQSKPATKTPDLAPVVPKSTASADQTTAVSTMPDAAPQESVTKVTANTNTANTNTAKINAALPAGFSRIVLTDQMNNLQPGQAVGQQIPYPRINRLYLFTELTGYAGQILRHRWYFGDTLHTDAVLTIEDSPWRTYSENWLLDDQRGPWRVEIVDQTQKVIFQYSFTYQ